MGKTVKKQSKFARVAFEPNARNVTTAESAASPVPINEPAIYDDDIDVSEDIKLENNENGTYIIEVNK